MAIVEDTPANHAEALPASKNEEEKEPNGAAEQSPQLSTPDDPPPYTPGPGTSGIPPRRGPPCTCPRRRESETEGSRTTTNSPNPEGGETDWKKVIIGAAGVVAAAPVLATAGAALALPVIGFASSGVVGGSIAAGIQSVFYGGATGGLFAMFQSAGATIVAPSLISTVGAAAGATAGGLALRDEIQKSGAGGEDANSVEGARQNAAQITVGCECAACECDEDCDCACRRRRRRG